MPLPFILGAAAAAAGAAGIGGAIHGGAKMKKANDLMKQANSEHQANQKRFEKQNTQTTKAMDQLGELELEIMHSFSKFSNIIENIQDRPDFKGYQKGDVSIPTYTQEDLKKVYMGAGVLLGGLGGAAMGTAGGFAAAGATTAAVMALGTASTGTAIASLSGVAATNATLAALGGGAIAAGGGGMALGTTILGATTLGMGILVGGIIFSVTGSKLSSKAEEAYAQMKKAEKEINSICTYLSTLMQVRKKFETSLKDVYTVYQKHLDQLATIVILNGKTNWADFTEAEQTLVENTSMLVGLLFKMCKTQLVFNAEGTQTLNTVNKAGVDVITREAHDFLTDTGLIALA